MRTTIVNPSKKGKKGKTILMKSKSTTRRKKNPRSGERRIYYVAGESLYRQRPVFYTADGRTVASKLGKRTPRKILNPKQRGVYIMAKSKRKVRRRKNNPIKKLFVTRKKTRRNPSGSLGSQIFNGLLQGTVTTGTMIGGLYAGKIVADAIAGSGTTAPDPTRKAQNRNLTRAILTLAAAVLMPKFVPKFSDSIVSGLMAATTLGFLNTAFNIRLGELAGDEEYNNSGGLLLGSPESFDINSQLQVGNETELFGVTDLEGVNEF